MRTIILNFDGTWNGRDDQYPTNILKLHRGLNSPSQVSFYFEGPGNENDDSNVFSEFLGGAFGYGSWAIRDAALETLRSVYQPGDQVALTGFSRGAGVARMVASELHKQDINGHQLTVAFLGCFDTVGAYLPFGPSQQGLFHDLHVSPAVEVAAHAVAIHEDRKAFDPNLMNKREGITEMWFPGVHSQIGGGEEDSGLSDVALEWMLDQMAALDNPLQAWIPTEPNADAEVGRNGGLYRRRNRKIGVKVNDEFDESLTALRYGVDL